MLLSGDEIDHARVVLVERAHTLRHHPGQIALPGGAVDPTDASLAAAALREGQEETGLDPDRVSVIGMLPSAHVAVSGFDVSAVIGWRPAADPLGVQDPAEVAQVLVPSVPELLDPMHRVTVRHRSGYTGPGFWISDADGDRLLVWGLTAHLLDGVFTLAGWTREWDRDRVTDVPQRFLRDGRAPAGARPEELH
ncbi:MAG TPA: CoA pyrophosphatase [Candidatus Avipropionibacterium avicola]|uniref:CoA pyrophosphatase n=1 Tax=Candidatus Avipropionibacterium avicola TaxID=2840701 RepID=A0A9D1H2B4_9ACTN|nr:CoA pyrophosphatase [Candidatus Avipropionibacterium avicola]